MASNQLLYKKTPNDIMFSLVFFIAFVFLKIGHANTAGLIHNTLILFYIWLFSILFFRPRTFFNTLNQPHYYALGGFLLFLFVGLSFANGLATTILGVGAYVQILAPIFMYEFYVKFISRNTQKTLIVLILGIYVYYAIKTIMYLEYNPMAAREMVSVGISDAVMIGGGYALAYGFSVLLPVMVYFFINVSQFRRKIFFNEQMTRLLLIALMGLFLLVIFKSMFAISVIIVFLGVIYVLVLMNKEKSLKNILIASSGLFLVVVVFTANQLSSFLTDYLASMDTVISRKLLMVLDISGTSSITSNEGSMGTRFYLYFESLNTWVQNFFIGIAAENDFDPERMMNAGLGNHSEWFDLLAKFGLFSIFLMVYLFRPKKVYKGNQGYKLAFILLLILGMLNPVHFFNIYFIVFFYIPLVDDYLFADQPPGLSKSMVRRVSVQTQGVKN